MQFSVTEYFEALEYSKQEVVKGSGDTFIISLMLEQFLRVTLKVEHPSPEGMVEAGYSQSHHKKATSYQHRGTRQQIWRAGSKFWHRTVGIAHNYTDSRKVMQEIPAIIYSLQHEV